MGSIINPPMSGLPNHLIRQGTTVLTMPIVHHLITFLIFLLHSSIIIIILAQMASLTSVYHKHPIGRRIMVLSASLPLCTTQVLPCITITFMTTLPHRTPTLIHRSPLLTRASALIHIHHRMTYPPHRHLITPQESPRQTIGDKRDKHLRQLVLPVPVHAPVHHP